MKLTALLVFAAFIGSSSAALSTHSFTNKTGRGSHPSTLTYASGKVVVDLSAISGATVYRAIFDPNRHYGNSGSYPSSGYAMQNMVLVSLAGDTLDILAPRYRTFDATAAVQAALAGGTRCTLTVANAAGLGGDGAMLSLDVMCDVAAAAAIQQVDSALARFDNGDAILTFKEVNPIFTTSTITCDEYNTEYNARFSTATGADWSGDIEKVRYRIYRSTQPLTTENALAAADLIDEIKPLTCWDAPYYGSGNCTGTNVVPLYPINNLELASPGMGIYVDRYAGNSSETFYYFVSHTIDGAEDFSTLTEGTNATNSVVETSGPGMVLLREVKSNVSFNYVNNCTLYYYVRWEAPPYCNMPSSPYDYLVGVPPNPKRPNPMAQVSLHCWGGSINSCYGWWYRAEEGGLIISTNQYPYDWWTGYHENSGTLKSFADGTVQPFTEARYLSFVYYFAVPAYNIDIERIHLAGSSMGGSGTSMWGMRSGHIFSHLISWVGVHIPKETPGFVGSFMGNYGDTLWNTMYSNEQMEQFGYPVIHPSDNVSVWDYWDNTQWLAANPVAETPWMSHANGTNDNGIGWPQAWKNAQSLIATKRGFNFSWGTSGHSQRAVLLGQQSDRYCTMDFRRNQSYPAFSNGSLDKPLGSAPWDHDSSGNINNYVFWDVATVVDEADRWEMTVWLDDGASQATETVDITPRRLQQLVHGAGSTYTWEFVEGITPIASGNATADANACVTVPNLTLSKTHRTLKLTCDNCVTAISGDPASWAEPVLTATPNPFNPAVTIQVTGMAAASLSLRVFDLSGKLIADLSRQIAGGQVVWNAACQASGMYIIKAVSEKRTLTRKVVLAR